ncbi:DUF2490 domain-containing protein [Flagellimonas pelagia]|uniref:DUF2490 domain-containing protein n=1 Tax=Flagellimonas pelagia TaxID=2306998 RepID=A0A3A1NM02_9FLAO|nr:DUF2490 domain-containing protein [Allomuricauda maritima]RIV45917.1 DUF2490 domain-containing protein [Allomuricauda maritima]TXJ98678.1 DUF2490 domain-containing protein [Allomuricauda maritima]
MKIKWPIIGLLLLTLLWPNQDNAQEKEIIHRGEQWLQYNLNIITSEKWNLFGNTGTRWRDSFEKYTLFFGRIGAGYNLNSTIRLSSGFTYAELKREGATYLAEFRPYEELLVRANPAKKFGVSHRFRFEQRFHNPVIDGEIQSENTFAVRFRYALSTRIPITALSKENPDFKLSLGISDEIMINAGKEIVYNVFDKNRFVVSPTVQFNKWMSVALAWNNQFFNTSTAGQYIHTNAFWLQLTHTLNVSHKKDEDLGPIYQNPVIPNPKDAAE